MKPLPLVNGSLFVSSSFLDTLTCPRYSEYYKLESRVSNSEGAGLRFGTHLHSAMSLSYRLREYGLHQETIDSKVSLLLQDKFAQEPNEEGDWRNLNWAMEIYQQHSRKFEFENFELMRYKEPRECKNCGGKGYGKHFAYEDSSGEQHTFEACLWCNGTGRTSIMSEVPFVVKLFDYATPTWQKDAYALSMGLLSTTEGDRWHIPVYYHGFIDLLVSHNDLLFVFDWKSTSKLGQSYWDDKKAIAQPKGYSWAMEQLLGVKMHGYIIRALRTIEPPQYVTNGTASKKGEFKKISDWWDESLVEQRFDLGDGELEEWKNNAIEQVEQFLWHYSRGFYPQNKSMCTAATGDFYPDSDTMGRKYGRCQYYEVCHTFPEKDREILLNSDLFKTKETNIKLIA